MIGIVIISLLAVIFMFAVVSYLEGLTNVGHSLMLVSLGVAVFGILTPTIMIAHTTHDPTEETLSKTEKIKFESVDKQGDIYIFTLKDGTQVVRSSYNVIVSEVSDEPGIQQSFKYGSWGYFWPVEDWLGTEVVVYTPSNKG